MVRIFFLRSDVCQLANKNILWQNHPRNHTDKREENNLGILTIDRSVHFSKGVDLRNPGNTPGERIRWSRFNKNLDIVDVANAAGIAAPSLSRIENGHIANASIVTLRKLSGVLNQPVAFLGCFEDMPEGTFFEKLEKARCWHGHTKVEMAKEIGVHVRMIFNWKDKEPGPVVKRRCLPYLGILLGN